MYSRVLAATWLVGWLIGSPSAALMAQERSVVTPLVDMIKSGRLPEDRQANVVQMICSRGNAADLQFIFERCVADEGFSDSLRRQALSDLIEAAATRKLKPAGDLAGLAALLQSGDAVTRKAAVRLAGLWQVQDLADPIEALLLNPDTPYALRRDAAEALISISPESSGQVLVQLIDQAPNERTRMMAAATLAQVDLDLAAQHAADLLVKTSGKVDLGILLQSFLDAGPGTNKLAAALADRQLPVDTAKLALRFLYSVGRTDPAITELLSEAAGVNSDVPPLSTEALNHLATEILDKGDAARGEAVFRRADLSCSKCHALAGAGGGIGPDLSGVGTASPLDYLINSVMFPNQAVKEEFQAKTVWTLQGNVYQGIIQDQNDQRLVLREANGQVRTIPADDVDEMVNAGSLMPKGLVNFMTHDELVDLVRFLYALGRPGPYAVRNDPVVRRWRVLQEVPEALLQDTPNSETFDVEVLRADANRWLPAYSKVDGHLPLDEFAGPEGVLYLQFEIDVMSAGDIVLQLNAADGIQLWIEEDGLETSPAVSTAVPNGLVRVTLRIDRSQRSQATVRVQLHLPVDGPATASLVSGAG